MMKPFAKASLQFKARLAGGLFLLLVLTSAVTEFFAHGRLSSAADVAAGTVEVSCMVAVTLLFYSIFKPVNKTLSLIAASFNFLAVILELLQFSPHGINVGLGFHGFYWLLIGYLSFKSRFLPGILGALLVIAGLCWLTFLSPILAHRISRYSLACALIVEALVMLWLLVRGVNVRRADDEVGTHDSLPR